ncbi:MAG: hypothetical protein HZC36_10980 [Armatimonadetes bacterium]|nr:hypothetical protein [Armatimonadota bacterium]
MVCPTLDELEGLVAAKRAAKKLALGSGVHAVLYYGADGSGKTSLALWSAQSWLCKDATDGGPCGECKACASFGRGVNPDFLVLEPQGLSYILTQGAIVPDKDSPYPLSSTEFLRTAPLQSAHKVVLLKDVDRLNAAASNAFLKLLEEPPPFARFLLTTSEVRRVKDTILSRCLCLACETSPLDSGSPEWVTALGGATPGRQRELERKPEIYEPFFQFAVRLSARPRGAALRASEEFRALCDALAKDREDGARRANAEGLSLLAHALRALEWPPESLQVVARTHTRVVGNAAMGLACDAMFARILG